MRVLLVGGTFELFRQFYRAQRHRSKSSMAAIGVVGDARVGAAAARGGRHHIGVATDHVIESFRNNLGRVQDRCRHRSGAALAVRAARARPACAERRRFSALPGLRFPPGPSRFPTKDGMQAYLGRYARHHDLPVGLDTAIEAVERPRVEAFWPTLQVAPSGRAAS